MSFKPLKQALASKLEVTYGLDPVPTGAANAIMMGGAKLTPLIQDAKDRNILKPYFGNHGKVIAGQHVGLDYDVEVAGAGTAGIAPGYGVNLKSCAMQEILNAADITGTAQAGAASTITLAAADSGADNAYRYMRIEITGGTGVGQVNYIRSNVNSTKVCTLYEAWTTPPDATSVYNIVAQAAYVPVSAGESSRTSYFNIDGIRHAMGGVRSDMSVKFSKDAVPPFSFKDIGKYSVPTDTAIGTHDLSAYHLPVAVNNANTTISLHGYAGAFSEVSLALGNVNAYRNIPGFEGITFSDRKPTGSVMFEHPTLAAKDFYSIAQAGTLGSLLVTHGTVAGNKVAAYCPAVQLINPTDGADAVRMIGLTLDVQPVDGNDEIIITVF